MDVIWLDGGGVSARGDEPGGLGEEAECSGDGIGGFGEQVDGSWSEDIAIEAGLTDVPVEVVWDVATWKSGEFMGSADA